MCGMEWDEICRCCRYYEDNIVEIDARIVDAAITDNGLELRLNNNYGVRVSRNELSLLGEHMKLKGTIDDFRDDIAFIASAIRRKIETKRGRYASKFIVLRPEMKVIGLKTTRYQRLTNHTVIRALEPLIGEYGLTFVESKSFINERVMVLNFITDSTFSSKTGDYKNGVTVINSETGHAPLAVKHYLNRVQCSNGMMVNVGSRELITVHVYTNLYDRLHEMIGVVIKDDTVMKKILRAEEIEIEPPQIENYLKMYGIKKKYRDMIVSSFEVDNKNPTIMDFYNAVTYVASHYLASAESYALLYDASKILG